MCSQRDEDPEPAFTPINHGVPCDLSEISLEEAAVRGGLPQFHTLIVGPSLRVYAAQLARKINATQLGNPLCPYINVQVEERYIGAAWCLITPKGAFGSKGY